MVGVEGLELDAAFTRAYAKAPFSGVILFARNVSTLPQVRALADSLRGLNDPAPLIAIDQEGGRVARLRDGVTELPSMMALGATNSTLLCEQAGEQLAFDMRRAGVSIDFAPVLDLAVDPRNVVIGARSFGADPQRVCELSRAFIAGMERGGLAAVGKHFPGHGDTAVDSHTDLPVIEASEEVLRARDLAPFRNLPGHASIMAAHVIARAFDPTTPASLSHRLLTDLLRNEWRFDGAVFTDCLTMNAIAKHFGGTVSGAVAAISSGADCALISHGLDVALDAVDAIAAQVPEHRLREASSRMRRLREQALAPVPLDARAPWPNIGLEIARLAVTVLRGSPSADPASSVVVSFESVTTEGAQGTLTEHAPLGAGIAQLEHITLPLEPTSVPSLMKRPIVIARRAHVYERQAQAIAAIVEKHPDAIVVSAREPFDVPLFERAKNVLAVYGDGAVSMTGLRDVMFFGVEGRGKLPVDLST